MPWCLLLFCVGFGSVAFWPALPALWLLGAGGGVLALLVRMAPRIRKGLWLLVCLYLGCFTGVLAGHGILNSLLDPELELQDIEVTGRIAEIDLLDQSEDTSRHRFVFSVDSSAPEINAKTLRLSWYAADDDLPQLQIGQKWRLVVRLRRPRGLANPHGFNYGRWLVRSGFHATGYVRSSEKSQLLEQAANTPFRQKTIATLSGALAGLSNRGVLLALAVGERGAVDDALWQQYVITGTSHLMAISGLHIGIAAMMGFVIGAFLVRVLVRGATWLPATLSLAAALFYASLAGFSLPTQRALAMTAVALLVVVLRRQVSVGGAWAVALLIVLWVDPLAPHSVGFWLSFGAVGALMMALANQRSVRPMGFTGRLVGGVQGMLQAQWAVFIGLLPVLALGLGQVSFASLPANLVCIPLFSFLIVPLVLVALILGMVSETLALPVWHSADALLGIAHQLLAELSQTSFAARDTSLPVFSVAALLAVLGALILLLPRGVPRRWLGFILVLPMFFKALPPLSSEVFVLTVLDVGQGLSVVARSGDKALVYDVGPSSSAQFNTASAVVLPYLRGEGVNRLDRLILSHADSDHAGAAERFLDEMHVGAVLMGERVRNIKGSYCKAGGSWSWQNARFEFLYPERSNNLNERKLSGNNASCVLLIDAFGKKILVTGDIEAEAERALLQRLGASGLKIDIMTAPHHGSGTSSTEDFVAATLPEHVVFSAGYKHHFGHPKPSVHDRYRRFRAQTWSTAAEGAIEFVVSPDSVSVKPHRTRHRVYFDPL